MREIKFRAWLKGVFDEEGDMVYFDLFSTDGNYIVNEERSVLGGDAVMQYTGLKDVNGKEVYEGDIVKANKIGKNYEVKFKKGAFYAGDNLLHQFLNHMDCEVIGNIYELEGPQC